MCLLRIVGSCKGSAGLQLGKFDNEIPFFFGFTRTDPLGFSRPKFVAMTVQPAALGPISVVTVGFSTSMEGAADHYVPLFLLWCRECGLNGGGGLCLMCIGLVRTKSSGELVERRTSPAPSHLAEGGRD